MPRRRRQSPPVRDALVRSRVREHRGQDPLPSLVAEVGAVWERGWQPRDLWRAVHRVLGDTELAALRAAIATDAGSYAALGARVAPGWMAQLRSIGADPTSADPVRSTFTSRDGAVVTSLLRRLPDLGWDAPPPSQWSALDRDGVVRDVPESLLGKIRGLLAKAESTTFDAEADALTAKAQELMARHRIDHVLLVGTSTDVTVDRRRVHLEDPYIDQKGLLLTEVASANGVRVVLNRLGGHATMLGFPVDLDVTEELFTSLLVQATAAMRREGTRQDHAGRSRTTRFRRSFLTAYAARIGERLREITTSMVAGVDADRDGALLPVLAARDDAVDEATDEAFPDLGTRSIGGTDLEGLHAGRIHADRADLAAGESLEGP